MQTRLALTTHVSQIKDLTGIKKKKEDVVEGRVNKRTRPTEQGRKEKMIGEASAG